MPATHWRSIYGACLQTKNLRSPQLGEISSGDLSTIGHRGENNSITVEGVVRFLATYATYMEEHAHQVIESRRLINRR